MMHAHGSKGKHDDLSWEPGTRVKGKQDFLESFGLIGLEMGRFTGKKEKERSIRVGLVHCGLRFFLFSIF